MEHRVEEELFINISEVIDKGLDIDTWISNLEQQCKKTITRDVDAGIISIGANDYIKVWTYRVCIPVTYPVLTAKEFLELRSDVSVGSFKKDQWCVVY